MNISMEGLGLELKYPKARKFPFGDILIGNKKEFDVEISAKVGWDSIRSVGEVRWASTPSLSVMKMGIFLKEIIGGKRRSGEIL